MPAFSMEEEEAARFKRSRINSDLGANFFAEGKGYGHTSGIPEHCPESWNDARICRASLSESRRIETEKDNDAKR